MSAATSSRRCVIFMKNGAECRSAWFSSLEAAERAKGIIKRRYGFAVIYRD